jgi:hypothetical protein
MKKVYLILAIIFGLQALAHAFDQINIAVSQPPNTPYFIGMPEINIDSEEFNTMILKIRSDRNATARLFWASNLDPRMNEPKTIWFYLKKSSDYKEYIFNVGSQNPYWMGFVGQFVIYPEGGTGGVEIQSARVITGNLFTNIASGWREFWGPKGREVIGSTINVIPGSTIFGISINTYIYWLIGIMFTVSLAFNYMNKPKKQKDSLKALSASFGKSLNYTILSILALWFILALNADYNYFNLFKDNFNKYFGRSIEDKRAIAYGRDYYEFLRFAKEKLPAEPAKFSVISSIYAPDLSSRIYLVPHVYTDPADKDLAYLLIFNPRPDQNYDKTNFTLFAKLNDNEYILRKKQ